MAVQKSRRTRSTRGKRRMHDKLQDAALSVNPVTGATHLRHHITPEGFDYRGRQIVTKSVRAEETE